MSSGIFRESALYRTSSIDGLDKSVQIVSVKWWVALVFLILLIVVTILWSVFSSVSTYIEATGIVMYGSGIETITASQDGIITDINIESGDVIVAKTTIARIDLKDTINEINTYQDYCSQLDSFVESGFTDVSVLSYDTYSKLAEDITTYTTTTDSATKETIGDRLNTMCTILKNEYSSKVESLQQDFLSSSSIQNTASGKVLEVYRSSGEYVHAGDNIASIIIQNRMDSSEKTLNTEVIVYMPVADGKKISKGMEVQVNPSTVDKETYGYIVGRVTSVSEYAVSEESMMSTLNNELLVESISTGEALIEIRVELLKDSETISGYKWTTKNGAPITIESGTVCSARVEIGSTRPIEVVFPFMKTILDGEE